MCSAVAEVSATQGLVELQLIYLHVTVQQKANMSEGRYSHGLLAHFTSSEAVCHRQTIRRKPASQWAVCIIKKVQPIQHSIHVKSGKRTSGESYPQ